MAKTTNTPNGKNKPLGSVATNRMIPRKKSPFNLISAFMNFSFTLAISIAIPSFFYKNLSTVESGTLTTIVLSSRYLDKSPLSISISSYPSNYSLLACVGVFSTTGSLTLQGSFLLFPPFICFS